MRIVGFSIMGFGVGFAATGLGLPWYIIISIGLALLGLITVLENPPKS